MALTQVTELALAVKIAIADDNTFDSKTFDKIFNLDQSNQESNVSRDFITGLVSDQAIDFGKVNIPSFIFIHFDSRGTGVGATADNAHAVVNVKIAGASSNSKTDYILLGTNDLTNDAITTDIKFTTLADTNTTVTTVVVGKSV